MISAAMTTTITARVKSGSRERYDRALRVLKLAADGGMVAVLESSRVRDSILENDADVMAQRGVVLGRPGFEY